MKILFVATVRSHIGQFHMPFIRELKARGVEVHAAFKDNSADKPGLDLSAIDKTFEVPFERQPLRPNNIKAYRELKKIIDGNGYDAVHCHTPMGAVITRLAAKSARKKGTKVIYTAHGFHFFKGASIKNWMLFYPVEKYLSKYTDCLITINSEDCELAHKKKFRAGKIYKVHGVGVELDKFKAVDADEKARLRAEYGYDGDTFIMIYPADLSVRKNQPMLFDALQKIAEKNKNVKLLLPGQPIRLEEYKRMVSERGIADNVEFLGYRRDINNLVGLSDLSVASSFQEGLPINIIEAMAMGNAIVATDVRGNNDAVEDGVNGYLVPVGDSDLMAEKILELMNDREKLRTFGENGLDMVKDFSTENVNREMLTIYGNLGLV
ncbi:MAG TPA: glycosyltransferase family 1 protein [Ruminococcaceae bacterium]|jgi:glycosyltransferase EpsD|nr:glycosyltransferase family 1 protein [Oscillospiraceae bacterium]